MSDLLAQLQSALQGQYVIDVELGRGGMATVFQARDRRHDRAVAIKVLDPDLAMAVGADRFRRELQITRSLSHPNILPVYDSGEAAGSLYYVMPYATGDSLRARLKAEHQLPIADAVRITAEVASALDHAHEKGLIHRDVKPENILFDGSGTAFVADFGIARAITGASNETKLTQTGMTLGTAAYMSPEQGAAERNLDRRSDLYALACVTYEMLAGEPPFTGATSMTVMARHAMEEPPSLTVVRPTIPDEAEDVVLRALSKSPADRYATTLQYAEALTACLAAGPARRRIPGDRRASPRVSRASLADRARRSKRRLALAVLAVPVVAAAAVLGWRATSSQASGVRSAADAVKVRHVAVLYFDDATAGGELAHLTDGLTESLIAELSAVGSLDVVSQNGVAQYRSSGLEPDSIAKLLDVGTVVTGRIESAGDKLRIAVRLTDGVSGREIERRTFEQPAGNLIAIRDTVAQQVAAFLRQRVGEEFALRQARAGTRNAGAWALLLRAELARKEAEAALERDDGAGATAALARADTLFGEAAARDLAWPAPHVRRGNLAYRRARLEQEPTEAAPFITAGLAHAEDALRLNPKDSEALEVRGTLRYLRWLLHLAPDTREAAALLRLAEADLDTAVMLNPAQATAWSILSHLHSQKPDFYAVKLAAQRAYEADAYLSSADVVLWRLYAASYALDLYQDAERWCKEGGERFPDDPRFVQCQLWLMTMKASRPDVPRAWRLMEELRKATPPRSWEYQRREGQMLVAAALARSGMADSARQVLAVSRAEPSVDPTRELVSIEAFVLTLIDDKDGAIELLKQYLAANPEHREGLARQQNWWWQDLRDDPRFQRLVGTSG